MTGREAEALLTAHDIETAALERFALRRRDVHGIVLGFAAFDERELRSGVVKMASVFGEQRMAADDADFDSV